MTRRPRRNRPPRLDEPSSAPAAAPTSPRPRGPRRALVDARVTGPHQRLSREAVRHALRRVAAGHPAARLGTDLGPCTLDEARAALVETHGWDPDSPRAAIDPDRTVAALRRAGQRLADATAAGAVVAVATSRPASLLGLAQWVARTAATDGARLATLDAVAIEGPGQRALWWVGDVAVVTDGQSLLADEGIAGGDEWLFAIGRPDLVVADRGFAGAAVRAGVETIAWADLDAPALAVAGAQGQPVVVVPIDEQRPAAAYRAVADVLGAPPPVT